jgi:hypothetical protein
MAKKPTKRKEARSPRRNQTLEAQRGHWSWFGPIAKRIVAILVATVTLVGGYAAVRPNVVIDLDPDVANPDPQQALAAGFLIENHGYFPLFSVTVKCLPGVHTSAEDNININGWMRIPKFQAQTLEPSDPKPFTCDAIKAVKGNVPLDFVQLNLYVQFKLLPYAPWSISRSFMFYQELEGNDHRWFREPLEPAK